MTTRHTIDVQFPVRFRFPGGEDLESANIKVRVTYLYAPVCFGTILIVVDAIMIDGDGLDPTRIDLQNWADAYLNEDGYERACEHARATGAESSKNISAE